MSTRLTVALGIALGIASFAAAKPQHQAVLAHFATTSTAIPIPLCPPDDPTCGVGGAK